MPSWWGKPSSKESKKKTTKESLINTFHRKFGIPSESKSTGKAVGTRRRTSDTYSEKGSFSRSGSRSPSPSKNVSRCQSFAERPQAQPLPLPGRHLAAVIRTDSGISSSGKPRSEKSSKTSTFLPLPRPACIRYRPEPADLDEDLVVAYISSESSIESDDPTDSRRRSPLDSDYEFGGRTATGSPSSMAVKDQSPVKPKSPRGSPRPVDLSLHQNVLTSSPKRRPPNVLNLHVPNHGAFFSAPDSSMSSPSRSPMRGFGNDQAAGSAFWLCKPYPDFPVLGSGQCSSPGSGQNSGHNSMGGDMSGQLFWQPSRGSPEISPIPSPRMASPGPSSRIHSGAVTPNHPRACGGANEPHSSRGDDGKQQSHPLPLPPVNICNSSPFSHPNSAATSPSVPRSPTRAENLASPGSRWKKGKLLGRGTFGHVYVGFNSDTGEMCAMKEVTLFADDAKSKESAKQLSQEIAMLSRLRHPNIVQYYGSETVDDKLYIYLEYVSGGSIHKLLQEYGEFGESAIRNYTHQILSGLAFLHAKNTVHRDIKGANILVDPNGRVKLADFGMAKHITGQSCPLSFKGSPYWMAPEVIKNSSGCNLAVDIWSLGCTILEMATAKPPWSQYEGVAAMFKIGNSKELPPMPENLPEEGKDFILQCLRRNPNHRPTAAQLLEHPFVKSSANYEKAPASSSDAASPLGVTNGVKPLGIVEQSRNLATSESERLAIHSFRATRSNFHSSEIQIPRNLSCPVSPIGSPLLHSRSPPHLNGRMSPSPISSPCATSGSSTPLTAAGGGGALPFHHLNQSIFLQEGFGSLPKGSYINSPRDTDNIFRGAGQHGFQELSGGGGGAAASGNDNNGRQFGGSSSSRLHDGQFVLADRVSQQLLKDPVKLNPSLGGLHFHNPQQQTVRAANGV